MRLLVYSTSRTVGGAELVLGYLLRELDPGIEVGVFRGGVVHHPRYPGVRVFGSGLNLTHLYHGRLSYLFFLLRDLGYYSGAIFEVYDPALGHILGGGGRYDGFLAKFGPDLPAAGFSLYLERVHVAQMEEESRRAERTAS